MNGILAIILGALAIGAEGQSLKRQPHDHTIYTVQGSPDHLGEFQKEIGASWKGGVLLTNGKDTNAYRYWAFSERTAPQARTFIFGSMQFGLELKVEAYDEQQFFPAERAELDSIAIKCGLKVDPFFLTPQRELRFTPEPDASVNSVNCALGQLKASGRLRGMPMGFVGNEVLPEKAN